MSHATIYDGLYVQARGNLRAELTTALRTGRIGRTPRHGTSTTTTSTTTTPTTTAPACAGVSISERPPEAGDRAIPGQWEGNLLINDDTGSAIGTLAERSTGFLLLLHLPEDHRAETVATAMRRAITTLPEQLCRSLPGNSGNDTGAHADITNATGLPIYFADPRSPWKRAAGENTSGLLRQYFPEGTDLSFHGPGILDNVAAEVNARPRERYGFRTPAYLMQRLLDAGLTPDADAPDAPSRLV